MVKDAAFYDNLVRSPRKVLRFRDFERLLLAFGFICVRQRGSHRAYKHPRVPDVLTIQPDGKDARPYQVRKFLDMKEQFHLELDA